MTKENADKDGGEFLRKEDSGPTEKEWKVLKERSRKRGQSGGIEIFLPRREPTSIYSCTVYEIFDRNTRCGTGINSGVPSRYERGTFRVLERWNGAIRASVFMCARLDIYYRSYPCDQPAKYLIFPIF